MPGVECRHFGNVYPRVPWYGMYTLEDYRHFWLNLGVGLWGGVPTVWEYLPQGPLVWNAHHRGPYRHFRFNLGVQSLGWSADSLGMTTPEAYGHFWFNLGVKSSEYKQCPYACSDLKMEKRQINAISVNFHLIKQAIWGGIWKYSVIKVRQTVS